VSAAKMDKLARMANQIADFFAPMPEGAATEGAATHLRRYWTPKMIREIIEYTDSGYEGLSATAARAVRSLKEETQDSR